MKKEEEEEEEEDPRKGFNSPNPKPQRVAGVTAVNS